MTYGTAGAVTDSKWDATFRRWAKPLSDTEEEKADNAASIIRAALKASSALSGRNVEVYATGSYRNNTNVRGESDIDVAAVCHDTFYYDGLPPGTASSIGITPATYSFSEFRRDVHDALHARFGTGMTPSDKAFNIHENTYRLEADVTPFFEFRRYRLNEQNSYVFNEGVKSFAASGAEFINWHRDHYAQGVKRNNDTGRRFKRITRILKNVKFDMIENGTPAAATLAKAMPSFLIECLVFNAHDVCFHPNADGYVQDVRTVVADLWERTKPEGNWNDMVEVNYRKWLFRGAQPWNRDTVNAFLYAAFGHTC